MWDGTSTGARMIWIVAHIQSFLIVATIIRTATCQQRSYCTRRSTFFRWGLLQVQLSLRLMGWFGIFPVGSQQFFKTISKHDVFRITLDKRKATPWWTRWPSISLPTPRFTRLAGAGGNGYLAFLHIYPPYKKTNFPLKRPLVWDFRLPHLTTEG